MLIELVLFGMLGLVFIIDFIMNSRKKSYANKPSNDFENDEGFNTKNLFSFINQVKNFFNKKNYLVIFISMISLIIIVQFIKPISFNESIKMEIGSGSQAGSVKIILADYGSSKLIPSKLLNYKIQNLNGKWIELSKVYDGENKFHIDNIEFDKFIKLIQYNFSENNNFINYPYLISKNNDVVNFLIKNFNKNLFAKEHNMKIYFKKNPSFIKQFSYKQYRQFKKITN